MLTPILSNQAFAIIVLPPPPPPAPGPGPGGGGAGAGAVGGFLGFVGFLALYDFIRRDTCVDFLGLGGPGFNEPITPGQNVRPPRCQPVKKPVVRARG
jgi:hypothetical protein